MKKHDVTKKRTIKGTVFMIAAVFAISAIIITSLLMTTGTTTEGKEVKTYNKYYSHMVVAKNETLWDIAKRYAGKNESGREYSDKIKKLNNMTDDKIYEGMNLIYYYYTESN